MRLLLVLVVLVISSTLFPTQFATGDLISKVCAKTDYPRFCEIILRSSTGAPKADKKFLARIMLEAANTEAINTYASILDVLKNPNIGEVRREALQFCGLIFRSDVSEVANAIKDFDAHSYVHAGDEVGHGAEVGRLCDVVIKYLGVYPSPVPDGGENHHKLSLLAKQLLYQLIFA